jgi:hypothetical protein
MSDNQALQLEKIVLQLDKKKENNDTNRYSLRIINTDISNNGMIKSEAYGIIQNWGEKNFCDIVYLISLNGWTSEGDKIEIYLFAESPFLDKINNSNPIFLDREKAMQYLEDFVSSYSSSY